MPGKKLLCDRKDHVDAPCERSNLVVGYLVRSTGRAGVGGSVHVRPAVTTLVDLYGRCHRIERRFDGLHHIQLVSCRIHILHATVTKVKIERRDRVGPDGVGQASDEGSRPVVSVHASVEVLLEGVCERLDILDGGQSVRTLDQEPTTIRQAPTFSYARR